ncbi:EscU/YscU/HrcU family type III secretion system export apparatus switch protein [Dethiobacter alkaliphilus]|uniref:Cytoplasmic domain of flagellar protein FhlB-like protein n=1 Tax=Dethiobacter alkaliphilus AHT 1 TaxID=555088 RepID=C0GDK2_DETAL|nr:EscU/YscU/HrcU family type III secretion system export apparatus switch protein [Dethiobacter alkaliphilus]EEG78723.1 cytoplasmic domain of flagellar protein FhlB-like protein [Dethiobacter alkaliphilus AHT 1]
MQGKKPLKAVALQYQEEKDDAPRVVARGAGKIAEQILLLAQEHGVPVKQSKVLAETLSLVEPGDEIPEGLYLAVAQIMSEVLAVDASQH